MSVYSEQLDALKSQTMRRTREGARHGVRGRLSQLAFDLHRRRVYRAVVAYSFVGWLVLQTADVVFPLFGVSETALKALACVAATGLPITVIIAWIYQITPHGLVVDRGDGVRSRVTRTDVSIVVTTIAIATAFFALLTISEPQAASRIAITATDVAQPGVAVEPIAPGLEQELRRQLASEELKLGPAYSGAPPVSFLLWISVQPSGDDVHVRALLLEADGNGATRYDDAFDVPGGSARDVQRRAASRIAGGLRRVLGNGANPGQLSGLFFR